MAKKTVAVEIDHSRLVGIVPLDRGARGRVDLTTIASNQRRAIVRLFVTTAGAVQQTPQLLTSLEIENLSRFGRARPSIVLESRVGRTGKLQATAIVEGRVALRRRIDVSNHLPPGGRFPWAAAAAVLAILLLAGLGGALLLRSPRPEPASVADRAPVEAPETVRPRGEATERPALPESPPPAPPEPAAPETREPETAETAAPAAERPAEPDAAVTADEAPDDTADAADERPPAVEVAEQQWTVYFPPDSDELTAAAQRELERIVARLAEYPPEHVQLEISGHCAPAGWERGRMQLSRDRADSVARFLTAVGAPQPAEVNGFSSDRPVTHETDRLHLNRRVEIVVSRAHSPELSAPSSPEPNADR